MSRNPDLERLAKQLCEAEGHDSDELVVVGPLDQLTHEEKLTWRSGAGVVSITAPRWMLYRAQAEKVAKPE